MDRPSHARSRPSCTPPIGDLDEYEVALRVAAVFETLGVEYTLDGSLASSLHGEPRSTNDIDFAVHLGQQHVSARQRSDQYRSNMSL